MNLLYGFVIPSRWSVFLYDSSFSLFYCTISSNYTCIDTLRLVLSATSTTQLLRRAHEILFGRFAQKYFTQSRHISIDSEYRKRPANDIISRRKYLRRDWKVQGGKNTNGQVRVPIDTKYKKSHDCYGLRRNWRMPGEGRTTSQLCHNLVAALKTRKSTAGHLRYLSRRVPVLP